jgi:hypothetical protein
MTQPTICVHCKNPENPVTLDNSQEVFQRDAEGTKIPRAFVHRTCAEQWTRERSGIIVEDTPLQAT